MDLTCSALELTVFTGHLLGTSFLAHSQSANSLTRTPGGCQETSASLLLPGPCVLQERVFIRGGTLMFGTSVGDSEHLPPPR